MKRQAQNPASLCTCFTATINILADTLLSLRRGRVFLCAVTNCPDEKYRFPHLKNEIYAIRHPRKEKSGKKSTPHPLLGTIRSYAYIKPQNSCFDLYNMHKWRLTAIGFLKNGGSPPPVLIRLAGFTHRQSGLFSPKMRT